MINPQADLHHWINLLRVPGIGPKRFMSALNYFSSPEEIMRSSLSALKAKGIPEKVAVAIHNHEDKSSKDIKWMETDSKNQIITIRDEHYPKQLKTIPDPPPLLFIQGNIHCINDPQLAIVGSRNPTASGKDNAYSFAKHLATNGISITSGLALGIDGYAHKGALESATSPTLAVTATGLDMTYPHQHEKLSAAIIDNGGVIISEYPIGTPVHARHFPRRNRLISGLSLGTLVVEAAVKSGSLITARNAMEQGREVFAIPGSIHNPLARGCHRLIREGAKLVETADHILEELSPQLQNYLLNTSENNEDIDSQETNSELNPDQRLILKVMGYDPVSIDQLVEQTGLTIDVVSSILLMLELHGHVGSSGGGQYVRLNTSVSL